MTFAGFMRVGAVTSVVAAPTSSSVVPVARRVSASPGTPAAV